MADCEEIVDLNENLVFGFFILAVHVELLDTLYRQLLLLELDLVCIRSKFVREIPYAVREGGREEDNLSLLLF